MTGYREALESAAFLDRSELRARLRMHGRAPDRMLGGIVTNRLPDPLPREGDLLVGTAPYSAILTPKGKMVTDLRVLREEGGQEAFLLDLPGAGLEGTLAYFRKYLPPRLAKVEDVSAEASAAAIVGPEAPEWVAREVLGAVVEPSQVRDMGEGDVWVRPGASAGTWYVIRSGDVAVPAYDLLASPDAIAELLGRLVDAGVHRLEPGAWDVLRIEHGRPAFGEELDEDTIPVEAGLERRAIDDGKGCYTGQEVIIRIRDRGKVNRHLRGLLFGDAPPPEAGTELYIEGRGRAAGEVRSAVRSPRFGQTVGLGYVRRELEPPGRAYLGAPDGPVIEVRALGGEGWVPAEGDPGAC